MLFYKIKLLDTVTQNNISYLLILTLDGNQNSPSDVCINRALHDLYMTVRHIRIPVMPFFTVQMRRKSQSFAWTNAWMWTGIENLLKSVLVSTFSYCRSSDIARHTLTLPSKKPFWHAINVEQHKNSQVGKVFSCMGSKLWSSGWTLPVWPSTLNSAPLQAFRLTTMVTK